MANSEDAGLSFGARGDAYKAFRIPYPPEIFQAITAAFPKMGGRLAVDLGSGTGLSLPPLLGRFARVVAVEPDARMAAKIPADIRLQVINAPAETTAFAPGEVDLVTCATAFYWMDGPRVLKQIGGWLAPGGGLALYRYGLPVAPPSLAELLTREISLRWDAHRHPRLKDEDYTRRTVFESPAVADVRVETIANPVQMTAAGFVGFFGSTSYVGAYLAGLPQDNRYLAELEREATARMGEAAFIVDFPIELILASAAP